MRTAALLCLWLCASGTALAQVGEGTSPSTPGTSLGSSPPMSRRTAQPDASCIKLKGEEKEKCVAALKAPTPATSGPGSTGMGSGGRSASAPGPGTGTAPGVSTR